MGNFPKLVHHNSSSEFQPSDRLSPSGLSACSDRNSGLRAVSWLCTVTAVVIVSHDDDSSWWTTRGRGRGQVVDASSQGCVSTTQGPESASRNSR